MIGSGVGTFRRFGPYIVTSPAASISLANRSRVATALEPGGLVGHLRHPEVLHMGGGDAQFRPGHEALQLSRKLPRRPPVVSVEEPDELTPGDAEPEIARGSGPGIVLSHVPYPRAVGGHDRRRPVGRPVIGDQNLDRPVGLPENAVQRFGQKALSVVHGNDT